MATLLANREDDGHGLPGDTQRLPLQVEDSAEEFTVLMTELFGAFR